MTTPHRLAAMGNAHVYIHVPFCVRRCSYCDFSIAVRKRIPAREYVDCILTELSLSGWTDPGATPRGSRNTATSRASRGSSGLETLYFGGGTPSLLPPEAIEAILREVVARYEVAPYGWEATLEANPEDVTPAAARSWHAAGINRVSLGAQSFDDRVLRWMHRSHDAARIGQAVRVLRGAGFENISLDLIFGLPAELERDWARDLDLAHSLLPTHLSLYGLTVEERTPLARWISRGAARPPPDDRYAEEYLSAHERLARDGFAFYEVSNACRPGYRSRHNSAYWSGRAYRGLGPAAHSFDGRARRWNLSAWEAYRRAIVEGRSPVESEEVLTDAQRDLERVYLALRTSEGLELTACPPDRLTAWVAAGWAELSGGRVRLRPEGWLRLDALVGDLTGAPVVT